MDIFFYEAFKEEEEELQRQLSPHITAGFTWETIQENGGHGPPAPFISVRTQSFIPYSWAPKLSGILTRSTGYDHIEKYLQDCNKNIPCGYLPPYCSRAVAEQAMLLWMFLLRKLRGQIESFSCFKRDELTGQECMQKTLLVVGVGNIGYEVVKIGYGLDMKVFGVDIVTNHADVSYISIEEGLSVADIIVCAMNLTPENQGYFTYDLLKKTRPGVIFVNVSRGELSPSKDLLHLLDEGYLGGVALDVFNHESELADTLRRGRSSDDEEVANTLALARRPNVICTPHNAFNTRESVARKSELSVEQIDHFLKHGEFLHSVPHQNTMT